MAAAKVVDVITLSAGALRESAITTRRVVERGIGIRVQWQDPPTWSATSVPAPQGPLAGRVACARVCEAMGTKESRGCVGG